MKKNRVVIGMDCGESATKTQIANLDRLTLADDAKESLWNGNIYNNDKHVAEKMNRILLSICRENGIGFDQVAAIVFAFPGSQRTDEKETILQSLRDQWKRRKHIPKIVHPVSAPMLGLQTFYPVKPAIYISCDVNAFVCARDARDEYIYAGGWGGAVPDPGSGLALTHSILQYISQVYDRRSMSSPFFKSITKELSIDTQGSFHRTLFDNFNKNKLVEFTMRAADQRNIVAMSMLDSAAQGLVELIRHIATRLPVSKRIPVMLTGRLLEDEKLYRSIVQRKINATLPHITISPQMFNVPASAVNYAIDLVREGKRAKKSME